MSPFRSHGHITARRRGDGCADRDAGDSANGHARPESGTNRVAVAVDVDVDIAIGIDIPVDMHVAVDMRVAVRVYASVDAPSVPACLKRREVNATRAPKKIMGRYLNRNLRTFISLPSLFFGFLPLADGLRSLPVTMLR